MVSNVSIIVKCPHCRKREMRWVPLNPKAGPETDLLLTGQCGHCHKPVRCNTTVRQVMVKNRCRFALRMEGGK